MKQNITTPPPIPTSDELEDMRHDMRALQSYLSSQPLIDEQRLRKFALSPTFTPTPSQNKQLRWLNWALVPVMAGIMLLLRYLNGISWFFIIATIIAYIVSAIVNNRPKSWELSRDDYATMPLVDLRLKILKRLRYRHAQLRWGLPILLIWCGWFLYELFTSPRGSFSGASWPVSLSVYSILFGTSIIVLLIYYFTRQRVDRKAIKEIDSFVNQE